MDRLVAEAAEEEFESGLRTAGRMPRLNHDGPVVDAGIPKPTAPRVDELGADPVHPLPPLFVQGFQKWRADALPLMPLALKDRSACTFGVPRPLHGTSGAGRLV
jgi:hypothetical protein